MLPPDFPAWGTVHWSVRRWEREGVWDQILHTLRKRVRQKQGRDAEPSAAVIESQSITTSAVRGPEKGFDRGKKRIMPQRGTIRDERGYPEKERARQRTTKRFYGHEREKKAVPRCLLNRQLSLIREST